MSRGLFGILNTGKMGLFAAQTALNVTSNNISNANTPGYSRQRVDLATNIPMNYSMFSGFQLGTGPLIKGVSRIRDEYLDKQFRTFNTKFSFWKTYRSYMDRIETFFGGDENNVAKSFSEFWSVARRLQSDPTNLTYKSDFVQKANSLVKIISATFSELNNVERDINADIEVTIKDINAKIKMIADINHKIKMTKISNIEPNNLYDELDKTLDELSELVQINVDKNNDGTVTVRIGNYVMVRGDSYKEFSNIVEDSKNYLGIDQEIINVRSGKLGALFALRDDFIKKTKTQFGEFVVTFADTINLVHKEGFDASGRITGLNFFEGVSSTKSLEEGKLMRIVGYEYLSSRPKIRINSMRNYLKNDLDEIKIHSGDGELISVNKYFTDSSDYTVSISNTQDLQTVNSNMGSKIGIAFRYKKYPDKGLLSVVNTGEMDLEKRLIIDFNGNIFNELGFKTKTVKTLVWTKVPTSSGILTFRGKDGYMEKLNLDGVSSLSDIVNRINSDADGDGQNDGGLKLVRAFLRDGKVFLVPTQDSYFDMDYVVIDDPKGLLEEMESYTSAFKALDTSQENLTNTFNLYAYKTFKFDLSKYNPTDSVQIRIVYKDGTSTYTGTFTKSALSGQIIGTNSEFKISNNGDTFEILPGADGSTFNLENVDHIEISVNSNDIDVYRGFYDPESAYTKLVNESLATSSDDAKLKLKADNEISWRLEYYDSGRSIYINGKEIRLDFKSDDLDKLIEEINATNMGVIAYITPAGRFVLKADETIYNDLKKVDIKGDERFFERLGLIKHTDTTTPYESDYYLLYSKFTPTQLEDHLKYVDKLIYDDKMAENLSVNRTLMTYPDMLAIDLGKPVDSDEDGFYDTFEPSGPFSMTLWQKLDRMENDLKVFLGGQLGFHDMINKIVSNIGMETSQAKKNEALNESVKIQFENQRESVKGVSIDEEMINLIKYQQMYAAMARVIMAADNMLGVVINNLGGLGR